MTLFALMRRLPLPAGYIDMFRNGGGTVESVWPLRGSYRNHGQGTVGGRVPLEAHIMSKCPDASYCLDKLIVPAMAQVYHKVDFRLSFIGRASNESSDVMCMHGPEECLGDMIILCAAHLPFPPSSEVYNDTTPVVRSLGFANCLLSSYQKIPERALVESCAMEFGIDFNALNACLSRQADEEDTKRIGVHDAGEASGLALLRSDFIRNAALGIKTSCTVRVNKKTWCIRDSGQWKDCQSRGGEASSLIEEINSLYNNGSETLIRQSG
ncbi:conserved hypothetical protein [Histoplasma capsulatum var. duboisii H88]|nr:conserved hypothetical protein [Histoplasma capsulatum H143]EGC47622.1 conserved hypothetical protein [Histoplasma capsulatum var. duboisii H88]